MPLLICPNDNSQMQLLERAGVQFDMCPTCRGIWLDRGELDRLMAAAMHDGDPFRGHEDSPRQAYMRHRQEDDDDTSARRGRRRFNLSDIFD